MSISSAAQAHPIVTPNPGMPFTDERGNLTNIGRIALQQMRTFIVNMNRTMPCNAETTSNIITLTLLQIQPQVDKYVSYEKYSFVADATSSGDLSAKVVTSTGTLPTLFVYKNNGGTRATTGDVVSARQYELTYVDSLNAAAGGFVLR